MPPGDKAGGGGLARLLFLWLASAAWACLLTGCLASNSPPRPAVRPEPSLRGNGYSLLHQLLEEQKDVSMLRFIKREPSDVKNLVKKIARASGAGAELLEKFAKDDPSIRLDEIDLPPGEVATRKSIAATKKHNLLSQSGDPFELDLLLTQAEAVSYAWHLAKITGENEPQPERARALAGISEEMKNFYQDVFALLLSREK